MQKRSYIGGIFWGVKTLCVGLKTTMRELFTKKITEQYPENRNELKMFDRFRGSLTMPHNENNEHKCVACHLCEMACPNGSIQVIHEGSKVMEKPAPARPAAAVKPAAQPVENNQQPAANS